MIDAAAYRANETNAKRGIANWRLSNINDPYIFQNQGFPVRADSCLDLAQILDTMQEGRFDYYMRELGGFNEEDATFFVKVCLDYVDFYTSFFQRERVVVPLSTLISHFVIYKKLLGCNPGFARLLELGPGCGYLSFFLRDHEPLVDYTQIESTESFYLLQSHINSHVFGSRFAEHALSRQALDDHGAYVPKLKWHNDFHYEEPNIIHVEPRPKCNHYPWWRIGEVATRRYDIVTSNANLNEFSREALFQYLSLIRDVLTDDGVIVAQCLGGGPPSYESIFSNMKTAGFVPVALVRGSDVPGRLFVVANAIFVGARHPLYEKYADRAPQFPLLDRELGLVNQVYFLNEDQPERKQILTIPDLLGTILGQLGHSSQRIPIAAAVTPSSSLRNVNRLHKVSEINALRAAAPEDRRLSPRDKADRADTARNDLQRLRLASEMDTLRRELDAIKRSRSWRITAPLRNTVSWTRRQPPLLWLMRRLRG